MMVRAKKYLGQHFLTDNNICEKIANSLTGCGNYENILEVGPGMGALTNNLLKRYQENFYAIEKDSECVDFLTKKLFGANNKHLIKQDFLGFDLGAHFKKPVAIIGNFPYNISSQILFKVLDYRNLVPELVGMFQKEVAERVCEKPGTKTYGILSVLIQAYYDVEYLFTVSEKVFSPPPKVKSAVIRLKRNSLNQLPCNEQLFKQVVKQSFNQRRKVLRNSIKGLLTGKTVDGVLLSKRPEQLSVKDFIALTSFLE